MIEQLGENEYLVEGLKVLLTNGNTIEVIAEGSPTLELARSHVRFYKELMNTVEGKVNFLINLNKAGQNSREVRAEWQSLSDLEKTGRVAFFGVHPVAKVLAQFVIGITHKKDIRFFFNEADARKWINETKY